MAFLLSLLKKANSNPRRIDRLYRSRLSSFRLSPTHPFTASEIGKAAATVPGKIGVSIAAVRGRSHQRSTVPLTLTVLLALVALPLSAQHRDTLYVIEEEPVYDTLFVHDTLYRHDTITLEGHFRNPAPANKIHPQTVTFRGNPVFDSTTLYTHLTLNNISPTLYITQRGFVSLPVF